MTNAYDLVDKALASSVCIGSQPEILTRFECDSLDRLITFTNETYSISATYAYNNNGKVSSMEVYNDTTLVNTNAYAYDAENRLTGIVNRCSLSFCYGYNSAQQITGLVERLNTTNDTCSYGYDGRDQLLTEYHYSITPTLQYSLRSPSLHT